MNSHMIWKVTIVILSLLFVGCSTEPAPTIKEPTPNKSKRIADRTQYSDESDAGDPIVIEDEEDRHRSKPADGDIEIEVEEDPRVEEEEPTEVEETDPEEKETNTSEKSTSLSIRTLRMEDSDLTIKVKVGTKWEEIQAAREGQTIVQPLLCESTGVTNLEVQIHQKDMGTVEIGSAYAAVLRSSEDSAVIGVEIDGSCGGAGCEDDNIVEISCPGGLEVQ